MYVCSLQSQEGIKPIRRISENGKEESPLGCRALTRFIIASYRGVGVDSGSEAAYVRSILRHIQTDFVPS